MIPTNFLTLESKPEEVIAAVNRLLQAQKIRDLFPVDDDVADDAPFGGGGWLNTPSSPVLLIPSYTTTTNNVELAWTGSNELAGNFNSPIEGARLKVRALLTYSCGAPVVTGNIQAMCELNGYTVPSMANVAVVNGDTVVFEWEFLAFYTLAPYVIVTRLNNKAPNKDIYSSNYDIGELPGDMKIYIYNDADPTHSAVSLVWVTSEYLLK
jgi:hypothetical protein